MAKVDENHIVKTVDFLFENGVTAVEYQTLLMKMAIGEKLIEQDKSLLIDLNSFLGMLQHS